MTSFGACETAFPDFDDSLDRFKLPGWLDVSWGNNTCPSLWHEATGLELFIDYVSPDLREYGPDYPRFYIMGENWEGKFSDDESTVLDWLKNPEKLLKESA